MDKEPYGKMKCALNYGGNAYTIHINEGMPYKRAQEIEEAYKLLHPGIYTWGDRVYKEAIKVGYIESVDGWKLKLPKYEMFLDFKAKVEEISNLEWQVYREGKMEHKRLIANPEYNIQKEASYTFYKSKKGVVSNYFKLKSEYNRLCLNNPVQTRGAHQLKKASIMFFEWIERNNLLWKVKICNSPYDEMVVECEEDLAEIVRKNLSKYMMEAGNYYLTNLKIKADAKIGDSWGSAK